MYKPNPDRYAQMMYRRCGHSGLQLPALSLGLWHNFGEIDSLQNCRSIVQTAFNAGITHIDLANNYGPPPGAAEEMFGVILKKDLLPYRDELIISTKAGWPMWPGPYGDGGSRKYLTSSLDQSLKRMGLNYVDLFYHHRPDPQTPLEETAMALDSIVRQGKALYIGISSYGPKETTAMASLLKSLGTPLLIHQPRYSLLDRKIEDGLLDVIKREKIGCIPFSPLAQGLLTDKYLQGVPQDSRAASHRGNGALEAGALTPQLVQKMKSLHSLAQGRGQMLQHMALSWLLQNPLITSVLLGVSRPEQITDALKSLENLQFAKEEMEAIETALR